MYDRYTNHVQFIRDGKDVTKSNWMRHVQPAFHGENQNLVAYQDGQDIYFLTVRQVDRDEELFVWYGYDFAKRIQVRTYTNASEERPMARYVGNFPQQHPVDVSRLHVNTLQFLTLKSDPNSRLLNLLLSTYLLYLHNLYWIHFFVFKPKHG